MRAEGLSSLALLHMSSLSCFFCCFKKKQLASFWGNKSVALDGYLRAWGLGRALNLQVEVSKKWVHRLLWMTIQHTEEQTPSVTSFCFSFSFSEGWALGAACFLWLCGVRELVAVCRLGKAVPVSELGLQPPGS